MIAWSSPIRFPGGQCSVDLFRNALPSLLLVLLALTLGSSRLAGQETSTAPQTPLHAVPQETTFLIQLTEQLDTRRVPPGEHFRSPPPYKLTAHNHLPLPPRRHLSVHDNT